MELEITRDHRIVERRLQAKALINKEFGVEETIRMRSAVDIPIDEADRSFAPWRKATEAEHGSTRLRCGRDRLEMFAAMLLSLRSFDNASGPRPINFDISYTFRSRDQAARLQRPAGRAGANDDARRQSLRDLPFHLTTVVPSIMIREFVTAC